MPCQVYEPSYSSREVDAAIAKGEKHAAQAKKFKEIADKLTHENDILRETILEVAEKFPKAFTATFLKKVGADQVKHRKEDLARLEEVFRKSRNAEKLGLVMLADPNKPLIKQLGFDPDEF